MSETTEGGVVRCGCGRAVPCRHCPTTPGDELSRLRRWKEEALPVIDGLQELGRALGMPLGSRITGPEAVDRLAALLAEARAEAWDEGKHSEHTPACRAGDFPGECSCENPYRAGADQ